VSVGRWISVDDELPPNACQVLVYLEAGFTTLGSYYYLGTPLGSGTHWWDEASRGGDPVTHWMPLPDPPSGGSRKAAAGTETDRAEGFHLPLEVEATIPAQVVGEVDAALHGFEDDDSLPSSGERVAQPLGSLPMTTGSRQPEEGEKCCTWIEEGEDDVWLTSCGQLFRFNVGTPAENGFKWCGYCGKSLVQDSGTRPGTSAPDGRGSTPETGGCPDPELVEALRASLLREHR
jgi:hypothetical protein